MKRFPNSIRHILGRRTSVHLGNWNALIYDGPTASSVKDSNKSGPYILYSCTDNGIRKYSSSVIKSSRFANIIPESRFAYVNGEAHHSDNADGAPRSSSQIAPRRFSKLSRIKDIVLRDLQGQLGSLLTINYRVLKFYFIMKKTAHDHEKYQHSVASIMLTLVQRHPDKAALVNEHKKWTFVELENFANQVANLFLSKGTEHQEVVALFGPSSLEYVGVWLGLSKIGATTALVNNNLVTDSLINSLNAAKAKKILVDLELKAQYEAVMDKFPQMDVIYYDTSAELHHENNLRKDSQLLNAQLSNQNSTPPVLPKRTKGSVQDDVLFYIFTSGTTGMPKPCIYTQRRFMTFSKLVELVAGLKPDDIIYCPLPLYHTAGGITIIGQTLLHGCTVVIRKKFSAGAFWSDIVKNNCTVAQYIGEICRFLLAQPPSDQETKHHLRMFYGQGLRPAIWEEFQSRFRIPRILETYGSTEGIASFANMYDKPGAVGYMSPLLQSVHPQAIIRVNKDTGEPLRNTKGFCEKVSPGEEGELISKVTSDPLRKFDGYTSKAATSSKISSNVFQAGDQYFRTGDMMKVDDEGFVYFVDRMGDSYRWKGENIASAEVETIVSSMCGYCDVAVYSVKIPGYDGKAGMACIVATPGSPVVVDSTLTKRISQRLPPYSVPVFIRLTDALNITGTFKFQKMQLKEEGFNPDKCRQDKLFYLNSVTGGYEPLTSEIYAAITQRKVRF